MKTILDPEPCWRVLLTLGHFFVNLFQRVAEALLFCHAAVWWVSRRIRIEREDCCDDAVVAAGCEPMTYAESLVARAERTLAARAGRCAAAALYVRGGSGDLRGRVARILRIPSNGEVHRRVWPPALLAIFVLSAAATCAVSQGQQNAEDAKTNSLPAKEVADDAATAGTQPPTATATAPPWGEAVEGVQLGLRAEHLQWKSGETPTFHVECRNSGKKAWRFTSTGGEEGFFELLVDGKSYVKLEPNSEAPLVDLQRDATIPLTTVSMVDWCLVGAVATPPCSFSPANTRCGLPLGMLLIFRSHASAQVTDLRVGSIQLLPGFPQLACSRHPAQVTCTRVDMSAGCRILKNA
ncbi:MAG: hypothetical protein NTW21_38470 [Verrucomicrobia bacterium]|nr:hypothetical protein [Verrucomicrobiota bacterium]